MIIPFYQPIVCPILIGRNAEMTMLQACLEAAARGRGGRSRRRPARERPCQGREAQAVGVQAEGFDAPAGEAAEDRRAELQACGAPLATASPSCAGALGASDVVSVLARWLGVEVEEAP